MNTIGLHASFQVAANAHASLGRGLSLGPPRQKQWSALTLANHTRVELPARIHKLGVGQTDYTRKLPITVPSFRNAIEWNDGTFRPNPRLIAIDDHRIEIDASDLPLTLSAPRLGVLADGRLGTIDRLAEVDPNRFASVVVAEILDSANRLSQQSSN
ncbi:MAG: hypothetical protein AAF449_20575, partial [Myxococcota bacterium]